jgi:streptogramin lyase
MRRSDSITTVGALLACTVCIGAAIAQPQDTSDSDEWGLVLRTLPSPTATPADLAWDGEALWVADWQEAELIRIDPADGRVLQRLAAPCYRPRGLTWAEGVLYVADDAEGRIFVFDPHTQRTLRAYPLPSRSALGLAWDGEALWVADDAQQTLQRLIPQDGTALTYFAAPTSEPGGLAFDGTYLWVTHRRRDRVYLVDPQTQKVLTSFDSPGPYPCGLAPAPEGRLWLADFEEGLLRLCAPREASSYQTSDWREAEICMTYRIENQGPGSIVDAVVNFAVAESELENQVLLEPLRYFGPVDPNIGSDQWGQMIATFRRSTIGPGERFEVGYRARAKIGRLNYILFPEKVGSLSEIPGEIRKAYTVDGERLQVRSELVSETAKSIVGDETNPYWIARKIYDWVIDTLEYELVGGWDVPETLIKRGTGSCSEYTFLFIALCRAVGLPARYEAGASLRGDDVSVDDVHHRWAEVYLPGYGWIPYDPSRGDQPSPGGQADAIGRLGNTLFITTHSGGGSDALSWTYNAHGTYSMEGRCAINEDEWVLWRRAKQEGEAVMPSGAQVKP